eukprot:Rmarinus@m.18515
MDQDEDAGSTEVNQPSLRSMVTDYLTEIAVSDEWVKVDKNAATDPRYRKDSRKPSLRRKVSHVLESFLQRRPSESQLRKSKIIIDEPKLSEPPKHGAPFAAGTSARTLRAQRKSEASLPQRPQRKSESCVVPKGHVRRKSSLTVHAFDGSGAERTKLLSFPAGVTVEILETNEDGWSLGRYNGHTGWFPASYVVGVDSDDNPSGAMLKMKAVIESNNDDV